MRQVTISLDPASVPALPGARACIAAGHLSSLHAANSAALAVTAGADRLASEDPGWLLLVDPQTAGGLLAGVPEEKAEECLARLREAGCEDAAVVGRVLAAGAAGAAGGGGGDALISIVEAAAS
jgi:selenide,water dikinase